MAKIRDIVKDAVAEITEQLKAIKESDEEDLAQIAESFDAIAGRADQAATTLWNADQALSSVDEEVDEETGEPEEDEQPEEEEEEPEQPRSRGRSKKEAA